MVRRQALGVVHRAVEVVQTYHDFEEEHVVVVRATHEVPGNTSYTVSTLSMEAAADLHRQLGDALNYPQSHDCSMLRSRLEDRLTELENRLSNTLEFNHLWDGS